MTLVENAWYEVENTFGHKYVAKWHNGNWMLMDPRSAAYRKYLGRVKNPVLLQYADESLRGPAPSEEKEDKMVSKDEAVEKALGVLAAIAEDTVVPGAARQSYSLRIEAAREILKYATNDK